MIFHLPVSTIVILLPLLLFSLIIHEFAHARTAWNFGDGTAKAMGRMTLNPLAHIDPIGALALLFVGFGWAKPVPVNPFNLHPRRLGDIAVSLAGPASNLMLAVISLLLLRGWIALDDHYHESIPDNVFNTVDKVLFFLAIINIGLFAFNLVPLFPLDGHHILRELLPVNHQQDFMTWQLKYGRIILMALIFGPSLLSQVTNNPDFPDPLSLLFSYATKTVLSIMQVI